MYNLLQCTERCPQQGSVQPPISAVLRWGHPELNQCLCPLWLSSATEIIGKWSVSRTLRASCLREFPKSVGPPTQRGTRPRLKRLQVLLCFYPSRPPGLPTTHLFLITLAFSSCTERPASACPEIPKCPASWLARAPASPLSEASGSSGSLISNTKVGHGPAATGFLPPWTWVGGTCVSAARRREGVITSWNHCLRGQGRGPGTGRPCDVLQRICPKQISHSAYPRA